MAPPRFDAGKSSAFANFRYASGVVRGPELVLKRVTLKLKRLDGRRYDVE